LSWPRISTSRSGALGLARNQAMAAISSASAWFCGLRGRSETLLKKRPLSLHSLKSAEMRERAWAGRKPTVSALMGRPLAMNCWWYTRRVAISMPRMFWASRVSSSRMPASMLR